ncbi:hypothetical protein JM93_01515 [Roseibium hamelinense]|uniref:Uncharacterized protein n=1 Tax=Roseibium hamelinense TaxID=150831 RepID=A0A562TA79_9HYPH|nr:hypothetical protein [Roseibium hamelinense]MTI45109.1 hypothetical protein [Roseibium hamelinense]TWI90532.1 hypothetical protein JM93_01515 [Roseibium hamelinense]
MTFLPSHENQKSNQHIALISYQGESFKCFPSALYWPAPKRTTASFKAVAADSPVLGKERWFRVLEEDFEGLIQPSQTDARLKALIQVRSYSLEVG